MIHKMFSLQLKQNLSFLKLSFQRSLLKIIFLKLCFLLSTITFNINFVYIIHHMKFVFIKFCLKLLYYYHILQWMFLHFINFIFMLWFFILLEKLCIVNYYSLIMKILRSLNKNYPNLKRLLIYLLLLIWNYLINH